MNRSERILVTGGAGFIGSHLCRRLIGDDAQVLCLDSLRTGRLENLQPLAREPRFDFIEHDVIEPLPPGLASAPFTQIYHLASTASPPHYQADPEHTLITNVVGTRNLLRLAEESGARLLLTSTSEVYGEPEVHPQREDYRGSVNCTGPRACYDEGKRAAETLAFDFFRARRADVRVARIFNTYGPHMQRDDGRIMSNIICQALSDLPITVYGDGSQTRSFCYVDDTVEGLVRLMACGGAAGLPVNLGAPHELPVRDLIDRVIAMTGTRSEVVYTPLPTDDPTRRKPDIARAIELLGWMPRVSLEQGLRETIAWFREPLPAEGAQPEDYLIAAAAE